MGNVQPSGVRHWEDLASIVLGILAAIAAVILHPVMDALLMNAIFVGLVIVALAALEIAVSPRWEEPLEMLAGAWLSVSPFWLGYGDPLRIIHVVIGGFVVILTAVELWQDRENIEGLK